MNHNTALPTEPSKWNLRKRRLSASIYLMLRKQKRFLPRVLQSIVGFLLVAGGIVGFLPILGFWMVPLGLALIATDIPSLGRWLRHQLRRYSLRLRERF